MERHRQSRLIKGEGTRGCGTGWGWRVQHHPLPLGASPSPKHHHTRPEKPHQDVRNSGLCADAPDQGDRRSCPGKECLFQPNGHRTSCQGEKKSRGWLPQTDMGKYKQWLQTLRKGCCWVKSHHLIWVFAFAITGPREWNCSAYAVSRMGGTVWAHDGFKSAVWHSSWTLKVNKSRPRFMGYLNFKFQSTVSRSGCSHLWFCLIFQPRTNTPNLLILKVGVLKVKNWD